MARRAALSEEALAGRLKPVFRASGYEGASLARLADASGLAKAALYHRFPAGKEGMAMAVLERAGAELDEHVLAPLSGPGEPVSRLAAMIEGLRRFYAGGSEACLVERFSTDGAPQAVRTAVRAGLMTWIDTLAGILGETGLEPALARERAEAIIARIQGALILSRALRDQGPFERLMRDLLAELTHDPVSTEEERR